ncbi:MAG: hypothetical protein Q9174_005502 [Haloplaca sp. 1 TL-2023]
MSYLEIYPPHLLSRVDSAIKKFPELDPLFEEIALHLDRIGPKPQSNGEPTTAPASKKRKIESTETIRGDETDDSITDVSFSIPQRKKLKLALGDAIRGVNSANGETECSLSCANVDYCIVLPVPEKAQPQHSFCVFPKEGEDHILFTVPGTTVKPESIKSETSYGPEETYKEVAIKMLNRRLKRKVIEPNEKDFTSQVAQAHRKGEKAVHVKAFRGSKDVGIIFVFKKPLSLFPFHSIASISYTSVLQRTFNLVISAYTSDEATQDIEFSMIDQADFAGIDAYIKLHQLQDASMAEQRRAKRLNVNGVKGEDAEGDDGEGELQKAQKEAQDLEDEDEEDDENFDPGSEGESEGSGSDSEEDGTEQQDGDDQSGNEEMEGDD